MSANIFYTIISIILTITLLKSVSFSLKKIADIKGVRSRRLFYVIKFFNIIIYISLFILLATIWGVKFNGVMVFLSSMFAVIGIALFAQWSILSNLTSSIIIFFSFPARVGDRIKVLDGDNSIVGEIKEISSFQIEIEDDEHNIILYPNNLFLQKPIIRLAKKPKVKEETPTH